jgi:3-dehydro-L-gulonate 2-dehydrogenase
MRIAFEEARTQLEKILIKHGCCGEHAQKAAYEIARNSLEGVYTHGINRFARLIRNIGEGIVRPNEKPETMRSFGGIENVDGRLGLGIINAWHCMGRAIELAGEHGIGLVALRNTNHWFRAATYGCQACDAGMAGICFTNTIPNMPAWGAVDSRIGNNPLVFAFPRKGGAHVIADMAMSQFSYGALELARLQNRRMPMAAGFDRDGELTADPGKVIESRRLLPTGYWKGAALSFVMDVFASCISLGNSTAAVGRLDGDEHGVSQCFIAINYKEIAPGDRPEETLEDAIQDLLSSKKDKDTQRIVYSGQKAVETRAENLVKGIPVDEKIWETILKL